MDDIETTQTYLRRRFAHPARPILFIAAALTILVGYGALSLLGRSEQTSTPAQLGAGPIGGTARAVPTNYVVRMSRPATVAHAPETYATPPQSAWVRQVMVMPGQRVGAGAVLAVLQPADGSAAQSQSAYQSALENLGAARTAVSDARAALDARQADVQAQSARAASAKSALKAAQSAQQRAQANLTAATQELQQQTAAFRQVQNLSGQGAASQSDLARAQNSLTRATNAQKEAAGTLDDARSGVTTASQAVADADQDLRRSLAAQTAARKVVQDAQSNLTRQQQVVSRAQAAMGQAKMIALRAPVSGTVTEVLVQPGVLVTPSTQAIRISPAGISAVEFAVSNAEASKLKAGAPVNVSAPNIGMLPGRVQGVFPTANGGEAPNRVVVEVRDPQEQLKPGTRVSVEIPLRYISAVAIPRTALLLSGTSPAVQIRSATGINTRPVTVAGYQGQQAIISEGLSPGEEVVISAEPLREPLSPPMR